MESLGLRLREERNRLHLTQAAFAEAGGVASNAQVNYESGKRLPKADYLQRISRLGVDINYVVAGIIGSRLRLATFEPRPSANFSHLKSDSDKILERQLNQLGEILLMTAATIASITTTTNPCEATGKRMAQTLSEFHADSHRFISLACSLGQSSSEPRQQ